MQHLNILNISYFDRLVLIFCLEKHFNMEQKVSLEISHSIQR